MRLCQHAAIRPCSGGAARQSGRAACGGKRPDEPPGRSMKPIHRLSVVRALRQRCGWSTAPIAVVGKDYTVAPNRTSEMQGMEMKMLPKIAVALCLQVALATVAWAQAAPPADTSAAPPATESSDAMPQPLPGDHWSYEVRDDITGVLKATNTFT